MTQTIVEDVSDVERQDFLISSEHERAHRGISEVESKLRRAYFFPSMQKQIKQFINNCKICKFHKYERKPYNIKIFPRPIN